MFMKEFFERIGLVVIALVVLALIVGLLIGILL